MLTSLSVGRGGLGRFGNTMFTIAGTIGIAIKSWQPYGFPTWRIVDALNFGSTEDIDVYKYLQNPLPEIPEGVNWNEAGYWWGYRDVQYPSGNWNIHAHLQCDRYFNHCMPLIRETFRFKDEPAQNDSIAIHVRFGDYQDGEDCYHPVCEQGYYLDALNYLQYNGEPLMVFSDEPERAHKLLGIPYIGNDKQTYIEDFKQMKKCKSFITANSSFSLMAAILGQHPDKKIVCPSRWFGKSWGPGYKELSKDVYPEKSIVI